MADKFDFKVLTEEMKRCYNETSADINLAHYCNAYDQLVLFIKSLGKIFYFVIKDVNWKLNQLRSLPSNIKYQNQLIHSDIKSIENFEKISFNAASRSLVRLHRALMMMIIITEKISYDTDDTLHSIAKYAYENSMYPFHPSIVRKTVILALKLLKNKEDFLQCLVECQPESNGLCTVEKLRSYLLSETMPIFKEVYNCMEKNFSMFPIFNMP